MFWNKRAIYLLVPAFWLVLLAGCATGVASRPSAEAGLRGKQHPLLSAWPEEPAPDHLALARRLIDQGHYDVALVQLAQAAAKPSNQTEIAFLTGICHLETGVLPEAVRHFKQAIQRDARYAPAYNGMGMALARRGDHAKALPHFRRAMALDPAKTNACNNLGYTLMETGHTAEAEPVLRKCLAMDPGFTLAGNNLAVCLARLRKDDQALALLLQMHPPPVAYRNMQALLLSRGDTAKAEVMAARARQTESPRDSSARKNRSTATPSASRPLTDSNAPKHNNDGENNE
jgi:Flp pilus assembly protein TadD